ncbi:MAG TPA: peptide deformylase, partial [bacterium]|nr:peptide deformylase [bacterium]
PQVGVSIRMIVFEVADLGLGPVAYVNPEIIEKSGEVASEEGCLSIPKISGDVVRHKRVTVKAMTLDGKEAVVSYEDLPSRVMQHEIDHLDGILFIDRLNPIKRALLRAKLKKISSTDYRLRKE